MMQHNEIGTKEDLARYKIEMAKKLIDLIEEYCEQEM